MRRRCALTTLLFCGCASTTTPDAAAPDAFAHGSPMEDAPVVRPDAYRPPAVATHATQAAVTSLLSPLDDEQVPYDGTCLGSYRLDAWEGEGVYGWIEPSPFDPMQDYSLIGNEEPYASGGVGRLYPRSRYLVETGPPTRRGIRFLLRYAPDSFRADGRVSHLVEMQPSYVELPDRLNGLIRRFNQWTPSFLSAVLTQSGRAPGDEFYAFEIMATDCQNRFVRGMGAIITQQGRDFIVEESDVYRPRLTQPDGQPYLMESVIFFNMYENRIATYPITVRTYGRLEDGGAEVMLGCETIEHDFIGPISIHVGPLREDYAEGDPCIAYREGR